MEAAIWFPLYARDYLADGAVRGLTRAQRSILIELWCFQWRDGPLLNDLGTLCRMLGDATPGDVQQVIAGFFDASEDGMTLTSTRLGEEKVRAVEMQEARRKRTEAATKKRQELAAANVTSDVTSTLNGSLRGPPSPSPAPPPAPLTTTTAAPRAVRPAPKPSGQPRKVEFPVWVWDLKNAARESLLGNFGPKRILTALTEMVELEHGNLTRIVACMQSYVDRTPLEYRSIEKFAQQLPQLMADKEPLGKEGLKRELAKS